MANNLDFIDRQLLIYRQRSKEASEAGDLKAFEAAEREIKNYEEMRKTWDGSPK